jgi:hypothetical protein
VIRERLQELLAELLTMLGIHGLDALLHMTRKLARVHARNVIAQGARDFLWALIGQQAARYFRKAIEK